MGVIGSLSLSALVQNIQSIQGMSQGLNGYYFLQTALNIAAKVFHLSRIGEYVSAYKFENVTVINAISFSHRILLLLFNIHRPKSVQGCLKLIEHMGVELFFLVRSTSHWSDMYRNTLADLLIGIPYLADGIWNIFGEKTIYERTLGSIKTVRDRVLLLEVQFENSRDLQRIQQNLRFLEEIDHFYEELTEKSEMLSSTTTIEKKINELSWLKKMLEGTENSILREEGDLVEKRQRYKNNQLELEKISLQLKAIDAAKKLVKADRRQALINLREEINERISELKAMEKKCRNEAENKEEIEKEVVRCRAEIKLLEFVADPIALDEELNDLEKLKSVYNSKLLGKQSAIDELTTYIADTFIHIEKRPKVNEHIISLKEKQRENANEILKDKDIAKLKMGKEIESKFNAAFDVHLLENIAIKLVSCDQFVRCLENATLPEGTLHKDFDWNFVKDKDKEIDQSKKIQKRDLYAAILIEIASIKEMQEMLEIKIKTQHLGCIEEYKEFKNQVKSYADAVENVFNHEDDGDRNQKFEEAKLVNIQPSLLTVRRALQREHNELLKLIENAQKILDEPYAWKSLSQRYFRPWSKICFGLAILAVRFGKSHNFIIPRSHWDLWLDIIFMGVLALSHIWPLFSQQKSLRSREVIVIREKDNPADDEILQVWKNKIASSIDYFKSLKPSWASTT